MNMKKIILHIRLNESGTPYGDATSKPRGSYEYKLLLTLPLFWLPLFLGKPLSGSSSD